MKQLLLSYKTLNGIFFYITWYLCLYGAAFHFEGIAVILGAIFIALHYWFSAERYKDLVFLMLYLFIGVLGDAYLLSLQVISYSTINFDITTLGVPLWMLMLYASFSTTINHSLIFIHRFPILASLLGGLGGSVSYYFAAKIGVLTLPLGDLSLFAIGVYWFLILIGSKVVYDKLKTPSPDKP